jgi:hypothetical protein
MREVLRVILLLVLAGAAVTFIVAACAWFMAEDRRLARAFRRVLGQRPDTVLIAHGRGRAAAFSFATGKIATAWSSGAWCLVYGLQELLGADLTLDGEVAARVLRGEPRRTLDRTTGTEGEVALRLLFDDPQHPDFELMLWPAQSVRAGAPINSAAAITEANQWLARIEAVLRRTGALGPAARIERRKPARTARFPAVQADLFAAEEEIEEENEDEEDDGGLPF